VISLFSLLRDKKVDQHNAPRNGPEGQGQNQGQPGGVGQGDEVERHA